MVLHMVLLVYIFGVDDRMLERMVLNGHNSGYSLHKNKTCKLHTFFVIPLVQGKCGESPWLTLDS